MAGALKKLAKSGIENVGDFLKSFRKKTYYHVSPEPDIEEFKINQPSPLDFYATNRKGRGSIYFTSDPKFAEEILSAMRFGMSDQEYYNLKKLGLTRSNREDLDPDYIEEALKEPIGDYATPYTTYPVKIKKGKIFNYENDKQTEKLAKQLSNFFSSKGDDPDYDSLLKRIKLGNWGTFEQPEIQKILKEQGYRGYMTNESGTVGLFYPEDVRSIFGKFNPEDAKSSNILKAVVPVGALNLLGATNGESEN